MDLRSSQSQIAAVKAREGAVTIIEIIIKNNFCHLCREDRSDLGDVMKEKAARFGYSLDTRTHRESKTMPE